MTTSFHALTNIVLNEVHAVVNQIKEDEVNDLVNAILEAKRIFVTGEGRTGIFIRAFAMRLMQMGLTAYVVGETTTPRVTSGDLLIAVSGSGETATTLAVVETSRPKDITIRSITASLDSPLARLSDGLLIIPGQTKEKLADQIESMQPLSNLFSQALLITLDVIGLQVMQLRGERAESMNRRHSVL